MPWYRRANLGGGIYFLTLVTHARRPIFLDPIARKCLHESIANVRKLEPFESIDMVLLPDHFHLLMALPEADHEFSARVSRIKTGFTRAWTKNGGTDANQTPSRERQGYRGVWQKRFWEHTVRDDDDLARCREYIWFNPVKHNLCRCPHEWEWSTFHRAVKTGEMPPKWQCICAGQSFPTPPDIPNTE